MTYPSIIPTAMPNGYNASIAMLGKRKLMSYRYHPKPELWQTKLVIQEHFETHTQEKHLKLPVEYADMSHEDGRFFNYKGELHLSLTAAIFPGVPNVAPPCVTIYGKLTEQDDCWTLTDVKRPPYGNNNFDGQSKNNVFFEHGENLYQIYQGSPEQVVVKLTGKEEVFKAKSPEWEHGEIRGGTQPLEYKGKWLRFFHSLNKYGHNRIDWSYCIGALLMQPHPPFQIEAISQWPVFSGDERYVPECGHWKAGCALPYGAIESNSGWIVSIGLNDSICAVIQVCEKDLNLP